MEKKIFFIHVGKCGGSTIITCIKEINTCHLRKPKLKELDDADLIIINIRDPILRFVSAFNYAHAIINYDIHKLNKNSDLRDLIAPFHIRNKIIRGYPYNKKYNDLINYFGTPNNLAEALTNDKKKAKAYQLMHDHTEHIFKSLGYYTNNGKIIEKYHNKISIISCENFDGDMINFCKKINIGCPLSINIKRKNTNHNIELSKLAKRNIHNFYKDTDYKSLDLLFKNNLINKNLYNTYMKNID